MVGWRMFFVAKVVVLASLTVAGAVAFYIVVYAGASCRRHAARRGRACASCARRCWPRPTGTILIVGTRHR